MAKWVCLGKYASDTLVVGCNARRYCRGLYFEKHLKHIALNKQSVKFTALDLSYLLKDTYDKQFAAEVRARSRH